MIQHLKLENMLMRNSRYWTFSALFSTSVFSTSLLASPAPIITSTIGKSATKEFSTGFGFTNSIAKRPFAGVDDQTTSLPYLSLRYKDFYIEGLDVGFNLLQRERFTLDLLASPRFYERKPSFASGGELNGVSSTRETYLTGLSTQFHFDYGVITLQYLYDAVESDGTEVVAQASSTYDVTDTFKFTPSFGLTLQNAALVDHFYGVDPTEATVSRAVYAGESSLNYNATFNATWEMSRHLEFIGQFRYEWIGDGITSSSLVDEDSVYFLTAGFVYRY